MKDLLPKELRERLSAPLPKEAIKPHPSKSYLSTIKAIYVTERLNEVFGVNNWHIQTDMLHHFEKTSAKGKSEYTVVLKTTFKEDNYGVYHECIASSTNEDFGDAAKGGTTDAITKIGSYLEIGIDVFKGKGSEPEGKKKSAATPPNPASSPKSKKDVLTPTHKSWNYAKERLKAGVPVDKIKETFDISEENLKLLQS